MAGRTENSEALATAFKQRSGQGRLFGGGTIARKVVPRHSAGRRGPQDAAAKCRRPRVLAIFGLNVHVLVARGKTKNG
jgi:hypothetical protein